MSTANTSLRRHLFIKFCVQQTLQRETTREQNGSSLKFGIVSAVIHHSEKYTQNKKKLLCKISH